MRTRLDIITVGLLAGVLQAVLSSRLDHLAQAPGLSAPQVPSLPTALLYGLMRHRLAADVQFARAASHAGDATFSSGRPALAPLLNLAVNLDPAFEDAYRLGAMLLASEPGGARGAVELLHGGAAAFPSSSNFPFLEGCIQLVSLSDPDAAARAWTHALARPGAPPYLEGLVKRMKGRSGRCVVAVLAAKELQRSTPRTAQNNLAARELHLRVECGLLELEDAVQAYRAEHGKPPFRLEDLLGPGGLPRMPLEPLGGVWILDADGSVRSSSGLPRISIGRTSPTEAP